jgi:hypothetical protein
MELPKELHEYCKLSLRTSVSEADVMAIHEKDAQKK